MHGKLLHLLKSPFLILIVALVLRVGPMAFAHRYRAIPTTNHYGFPDEIGGIAQSIAVGRGFSSPYRSPTGPTALMPPLYPYLVAATFRLWGVNSAGAAFAVLTLNSIFSTLTCVFLLLIGRMAFSESVGVVAAWAWVFLPGAVFVPISQVWYDAATGLLLAGLLWATLRLEKTAKLGAWAGYGLLWAVATLTNPSLLSVMPFVLAWVFYRRHKKRLSWARPATVALIVFAIALLPWLIRNLVVFGYACSDSESFGYGPGISAPSAA